GRAGDSVEDHAGERHADPLGGAELGRDLACRLDDLAGAGRLRGGDPVPLAGHLARRHVDRRTLDARSTDVDADDHCTLPGWILSATLRRPVSGPDDVVPAR